MCIACASLFSASDAAAEARADFQDWGLVCAEDETCRLAQTLMSSERIWLATVLMHPRVSGADEREVEVLVPQGVHFPSGLFILAVAGAEKRADWVRCTEVACISHLQLDAPTERQWRQGRAAELRFRPGPNAPAAVVEVSLMGVTAGLHALDATSGQRN